MPPSQKCFKKKSPKKIFKSLSQAMANVFNNLWVMANRRSLSQSDLIKLLQSIAICNVAKSNTEAPPSQMSED